MIVHVYRNLHKNKWSIKYKGKVIKHLDELVLINCVFRVQKAGRAKVLREKRKNVHAYVCGELTDITDTTICNTPAGYNPYKRDCFVNKIDNSKIEKSNTVCFLKDGTIRV
jgi:hypothetical protein